MKCAVIGGAGFLGTNICLALKHRGLDVWAIDNLSRTGSVYNIGALHSAGVPIAEADIREFRWASDARTALDGVDLILNLAAQTAVTTSIDDPVRDFHDNAIGHFNVLEFCRTAKRQPAVFYASTNKVYGAIVRLPVSETHGLGLVSPYGCSKGVADAYTIDYARTYGLRTLVFRSSCVYGDYQWGELGQGWLSWFAQRILSGLSITIYGDGYQARDILHASDWVDAVLAAIDRPYVWDGSVFNIGGGENNVVTLRQAVYTMGELTGTEPELAFDEAREGDQPTYISSILKARRVLQFEPKIGTKDGIRRLMEWTERSISTQRVG